MPKPRKGSDVTLSVVVNGPEVRTVPATVTKARSGGRLDLEYQIGKNPPRIMEGVPEKTLDTTPPHWEPAYSEREDPPASIDPGTQEPEPETEPGDLGL